MLYNQLAFQVYGKFEKVDRFALCEPAGMFCGSCTKHFVYSYNVPSVCTVFSHTTARTVLMEKSNDDKNDSVKQPTTIKCSSCSTYYLASKLGKEKRCWVTALLLYKAPMRFAVKASSGDHSVLDLSTAMKNLIVFTGAMHRGFI